MKLSKHKNQSITHKFKGELLYGHHACMAALNNPDRKIYHIFISEKYRSEIERNHPDCPIKVVSGEQLARLVGEDAVHQGMVVDARALPEKTLEDVIDESNDSSSVLVLDQVTDPHNIGAILRTCAVFDIDALVLTERHSPKVTGVLAKTASGALEKVPLVYVGNLVQALNQMKKSGYWVSGLAEQGDQFAHQVKFDGKTALVMGAEGSGLRRMTRETCDMLVKLPTSDTFSTLNVSNAAAVILYEAHRQKIKE